jgi:hypothetical protein
LSIAATAHWPNRYDKRFRTGALRGFWGVLAALQPPTKFVALGLEITGVW